MRKIAMRLRRGVAALVVVGGLGGGMGVAAQEADGDGGVTRLTLQDALLRATRFNSDYRQAIGQLELDSHPRQQWWARIMPTMGASYATGLSVDRIPSYVDFEGNPVEVANPTTVTRSSSNQYASLNLTLDVGQLYYEYRNARAQVRRSRIGAERQLNATLAEVQRLYLDAQNRLAQLAVEEALLDDRQLDFEEKERRFELLATSRSDLLSAELDLENQRIAVSTARGALDKALLALRTAIGDPELGAVEIEPQPPAPFDPSALDLAELVVRAGREGPAVAAAEADMAVQRASLNSAKALRWPTITLSSSVGANTNGQRYDELLGFDLNNTQIQNSARLSVSVPIVDVLPIFDGFQKSYSVASATNSLRNSEMSLRQTRLRIEESIRSKYLDLETAWENVLQRERAREVAGDRLAIVREEYLLANAGIEALRTATREEANARRQEVEQRFTFATALLALYEELGMIAEEAGIEAPGEGN